MGGVLIRRVIADLRTAGITLPLNEPVGIGFSGGADSLALAHLLVHYGRRVINPAQLTLLHVNHQWRPEASKADQRQVETWAKSWGVKCVVQICESPHSTSGESWENDARKKRNTFFQEWAGENGKIFTAHQGNDLFETYLWRLLEGTIFRHTQGIRVRHGVLIRPFLGVTRDEISDYLREEGLVPQVDSTNSDIRFLRSFLRHKIIPQLLEIRPQLLARSIDMHRSHSHFKPQGFDKSALSSLHDDSKTPLSGEPELLLTLLAEFGNHRLTRGHFQMLERVRQTGGSVSLPGGWQLRSENKGNRWVLEKTEGS